MNPSIGGMLWFSFFWLALAAALIWVVAYLVKRDAATKASNPNVKILAQQSIGPRERILVVNVLGRDFGAGALTQSNQLIDGIGT